MRRPRRFAAAAIIALLLASGSASAFNAVVSQDLPVLIEMLGAELKTYARLGAVLAEVRASVAQAREYTNLAKAAWGTIDGLRSMSWADLGYAARQGLFRAFPEARDIFADIRSIQDLDYQDPRSLQTLRGILWEEIYGPGLDQIHQGHDTLEEMAAWREQSLRLEAREQAYRQEAYGWEETCLEARARGEEGACAAAAHRADVRALLMLGDLQKTALQIQATEQAQLQAMERDRTESVLAYERWAFDLASFVQVATSNDRPCEAGRCLYERYADKVYDRVAEFRAKHRRLDRAARGDL